MLSETTIDTIEKTLYFARANVEDYWHNWAGDGSESISLEKIDAAITELTASSQPQASVATPVEPGGRFLLYHEIEALMSDSFEKGRAATSNWQPVDDGVYGYLKIAHNGKDIGIRIDDSHDDDGDYEWLSDADISIDPLGELRLCRRVATPAMDAPDGMDFPDSAGWWGYDEGVHQQVLHLLEWEHTGGKYLYHWADREFSSEAKPETFKLNWPGKFYKLHMPWEQKEDANV